MKLGMMICVFALSIAAQAEQSSQDYLIKLAPSASNQLLMNMGADNAEPIGDSWYVVPGKELNEFELASLEQNPRVLHVQPNYKLQIMHDFQLKDPALRAKVAAMEAQEGGRTMNGQDNPPFKQPMAITPGNDPMLSNQWGMNDIGAIGRSESARQMIVAVIDTGVDYNHEDLANNMWRNKGELGSDSQGRDKSANGIDDDGNGYIDDLVGWDFSKNDNKPYDQTVSTFRLLLGGGNPGHGTHCAGNVGASANNSLGIRGVAPDVQIMALRFLSEAGGGTTADAVKAIRYAVDNGAKVLSNSWGQSGENPADAINNEALKEAIRYSVKKGVLFIAAAGNGHMGRGYDNDIDDRPAYPASYDFENIVSVAAIDNTGNLGKFSNWGPKRVHIGAPGVNVFSTVPGNKKYANYAVNLLGIIKATWDGTSMAAPHVAGAAALYWSQHPNKTALQVKDALLGSAKLLPTLEGKVVSNGKLDISNLMRR